MNNEILLSIIVPTYNREKLIARTIESILSQSSTNFELIIIDDGSIDSTELVVSNYLSERVHYYKIENGERGRARNEGSKHAKGKYLNWFDSDDILLNFHVEEIEKAINKFNYPEIITLEYEIRDSNLTFISKSNFTPNAKRDRLIDGNYLACNPVIVRKDIAQKNPFIEDRKMSASEDYELWLRLKSQFPFHHHPICTSYLIQHDERSVNTMSDSVKLEMRFISFLDYCCSNEQLVIYLGKELSYFKMRNYLILAVDLAFQNHNKKALKYLKTAIKTNKKAIFNRVFWATIKHILF
jgi:glycosyltransferase involved in cell wall biosynthesis